MTKGLFITFEGGEGSGKSTQSKKLAHFFYTQNIPYIHTREPGGTPAAEEIRRLLVEGTPDKWHQKTEALLMFASRCEHWHRLIQPTLDKGIHVICDRFIDSSFAYQGYGRDIPLDDLQSLYTFIIGDVFPDITFYLDIDPQLGLLRTKNRKKNEDERFEKESILFHQRVQHGYKAVLKKYPHRFILLDGLMPQDQLHDVIKEHVMKKIYN